MSISSRPIQLVFLQPNTYYFAFNLLTYVYSMRRRFINKRVVRTNLDIYIYVFINYVNWTFMYC